MNRKKSLATEYPKLALEWHPTKNEGLLPCDVSPHTDKKAWWICPQGHSYLMRICDKTKKKPYGCPICSGKQLLVGVNDLKTLFPEVAVEWSEENDTRPEDHSAGTHKKVKWWPISFQKELSTQSFDSVMNSREEYKRAKEIYTVNFANHMTMRKNGEYKEYCRYHIPKTVEYEWSLEVKESLLNEICSGKDLLQVVNLSRVNLPEDEIVDAFRCLSSSLLKDRILLTIERLRPLIKPDLYKRVIVFFR